jgi:two-component system sensor histidine kinase KdpD
LGAATAVIASPDVADSVVAYARKHNLSKLVIGRDATRRLWPWQRSSGQRLAALAPDIDLIEIGRSADASRNDIKPVAVAPMLPGGEAAEQRRRKRLRYVWAALACALVTLLSMPLAVHFDRSNIVATYILAVVLVGMRFGRGPAALAAVLSVTAFDFFFVPPRYSFAVSDVQYLLTFAIMLAVGLITGQLTAGLRSQARVALHREERAAALYELARDLSGATQLEQVVRISDESIGRTFHVDAALLLPDAQGQLALALRREPPPGDPGGGLPGVAVDIGIAQWAFDKGLPAGIGTDTLPGSDVL